MDELADSELHGAVRYDDVDAVQAALSKSDCRVNQIGLYRWAPLHEAASGGCEDVVRLLLAHGADPNLRDALSGSTAVHYAAREGHAECLQLLLDAGGRYDVADDNGETAFDAASCDSRSVIESRKILDLTRMTLSEARKSVLLCASERAIARPGTASSSGASSPMSPEPARFPSSESVGKRSSASSSGCSTDPSASASSRVASAVKPRAAWLLQSAPAPSGPSVAILHASFEYHSKKRYLKVRVSKLSGVNLVSGHSSSIGAICVKCRLEPEDEHAKKSAKRKTEDVKVQLRAKKEAMVGGAGDASLSRDYPSSFNFTKPLEYLDIDEETIRDKTLRLQVCVSHRITRKSYVVGDVALPLRVATAKLLKEAYLVRPCPYADAPHGMRVLTASAAGAKSESDPDLRLRSPAIERLLRLDGGGASSHRASSDTQLQHVTIVSSPAPSSSSSVSVDIPDDDSDDDDDDGGDADKLDALNEVTTVVAGGESFSRRQRSFAGASSIRPKTAVMTTDSVVEMADGTRKQFGKPSASKAVETDHSTLREVKVDKKATQSNRSNNSARASYVAISMTPLSPDPCQSTDDECSIRIPGDCVEIPIENSDV